MTSPATDNPVPLRSASDVQDLLMTLIGCADLDDGSGVDIGDLDTWQTYDEAAILTRDAGLVLRTRGGAEFQITILRSK